MMKTKKRRMEYISFYNHTGLEKHFTKMAAKGWLIESISNLYWTYRRIEPQDIHFCVTYYPRASDFDPDPSDDQITFHDFCAHTGWQLACTWHQMQVFYNEQENPIPLETDAALEVETLHKACKKNFLPGYYFLLAIGLLATAYNIWGLIAAPITFLSDSSRLITGLAVLCLLVLSVTELTSYFMWYYRAKKYAVDGIFVDTPSTEKFQIGVMILLFIGVVLWFIDLFLADDPIFLWVAVVTLTFTFGLMVVVNSIKQGLKKAKASRGLNKFLTFFACVVLSFAMVTGVTWLTLSVNRAGLLERDPSVYTELPLSLADLTDIDEDHYIAENRINQTALIGQQVVHQHHPLDVSGNSIVPDLRYTITTVKVPFLYDWCKKQMYDDRDETNSSKWPVGNRMVYQEQDAAPWGAKEVYRLYSEEGWWKNTYLLCYENRIIEIQFDWEPTQRDVAIVRNTFSSESCFWPQLPDSFSVRS